MSTRLRGGAPPPEAPFPLLPLRTGALFPGTTLALTIGRPRSVALVQTLHPNDVIAVASQRDPDAVDPTLGDLYPAGTFARVLQIARQNERTYRMTLEGLGRMELTALTQTEPFARALGRVVEETNADGQEAQLLAEGLRTQVRNVAQSLGGALDLPTEDDPGLLADRVALGLVLDTDKAVEVLGIADVPSRLRRVIELLAEAKTLADLKTKIDHDVRAHFGKQQREDSARAVESNPPRAR